MSVSPSSLVYADYKNITYCPDPPVIIMKFKIMTKLCAAIMFSCS